MAANNLNLNNNAKSNFAYTHVPAVPAAINVNPFGAAAGAVKPESGKIPMSSPIADFTFAPDNFDFAVGALPTGSPPAFDAVEMPAIPALPAVAAGSSSLLTADRQAVTAAAAVPFHFHAYSRASSGGSPDSPAFTGLGGGDSAPDSPSSIASDLSSASSLYSAATSPRAIVSTLPRHSSTPSLAAMAAAQTPHFSFQTPGSRVATPPNFPSLKPAIRTSSSKSNLMAAAAKPAVPAFSLSGAGVTAATATAAQVPGSSATAEDEQPSKKKLKANDKSMRRVKSSPAVTADGDTSSDEDEDDDEPVNAKSKAAAVKQKPISLINPVTGKPKTEAELKKEKAERRLAKKAEAARQSRKRKKAYVQQLEEKHAKLEARLAQLETAGSAQHSTPNPPPMQSPAGVNAPADMKLPAAAIPSATAAAAANPQASSASMAQALSLHAMHRDEQSDVLSRLSVAVTKFVALATPAAGASGATSIPVAASNSPAPVLSKEKEKEKERVMDDIKALIERYVVNSRKRQQTVIYYLDRMSELLAPDAAVKVALWGLSQNDAYYAMQPTTPNVNASANANVASNPNVFSTLMATDVGLNAAQLQKLVADFRAPVSGLMDALRATNSHITSMREYVRTHMAARNRHVDELRHILNPIQVANYLLWLEKNPTLATTLVKSPTANHSGQTSPVVVTATIAAHPTHYASHGK